MLPFVLRRGMLSISQYVLLHQYVPLQMFTSIRIALFNTDDGLQSQAPAQRAPAGQPGVAALAATSRSTRMNLLPARMAAHLLSLNSRPHRDPCLLIP